MARWDKLDDRQRAVLEAGVAVWEAALASEVRAALDKGMEEARAKGVQVTAMPAGEQARFDALYLRDAETNARSLGRFGIDGMAAFRTARSSIVARDKVACGGGA